MPNGDGNAPRAMCPREARRSSDAQGSQQGSGLAPSAARARRKRDRERFGRMEMTG